MVDWKSALAALGATDDTSDKKEKTDIKKKRVSEIRDKLKNTLTLNDIIAAVA